MVISKIVIVFALIVLALFGLVRTAAIPDAHHHGYKQQYIVTPGYGYGYGYYPKHPGYYPNHPGHYPNHHGHYQNSYGSHPTLIYKLFDEQAKW